jgi:hypothetical protein
LKNCTSPIRATLHVALSSIFTLALGACATPSTGISIARTDNCAGPAAGKEVCAIPAIQGSGAASAFVNTIQRTEGVVTRVVSNGYFLQDARGDGDAATSDALFVYTGTVPTVEPGQRLRLTGKVSEFTPGGATRSVTQLRDISDVQVLANGEHVAPQVISLANARLDALEGMLVSFSDPLTVAQTYQLAQRGEVTLTLGRREAPTNRYRPGTAQARELAAAHAANAIVLDDGVFAVPLRVPYLDNGATLRAGDQVRKLTGVIDFGPTGQSASGYKIQPTVPPRFESANPRPPAPPVVAGAVRVASANVLNFFTTFGDGSDAWGKTSPGCTQGGKVAKSYCRGADNMEEFERQRDKVVEALRALDADAVGLMELQNNGDVALAYLVDALNKAIGRKEYAFVAGVPDLGTDAIRVGLIYKPARLAPLGAPLTDNDPVHNRPPLAQAFRSAQGQVFSLIVNHFKSKGSCGGAGPGDANSGDGQGCWNQSRVKQARRVIEVLVPQVVAGAGGDPDVLVVGDLNAYGMEDPVQAFVDAGFVNEIERHVRPRGVPYSFLYDGALGYLDHALATRSLDGQVVGVAEWHNNADEPTVLDYNLEGKPTAQRAQLYRKDAYRASDHDPLVVSLRLK